MKKIRITPEINRRIEPQKYSKMNCEKAGLNRDAWKEKDIRVYKFRCEVYSEEKPNGNVKKIM